MWSMASINGSLTKYGLPASSGVPYAITLGPDGAMWLTLTGGKILRAAFVFPAPTIAAVRNSGADGYLLAIQANSWVSIFGSNLTSGFSSRVWAAADIIGGNLPLSLDGVGVTVNGKHAYVEYISPTQINILAPDDAATGPVNVVVTNEFSSSPVFSTQMAAFSPAFFTFSPPNQRYVAGILLPGSDGTFNYLAPVGALGAGVLSRHATAGDIVELYATGFGPVNPMPPGG
jgi:uncharacterized protein (TIGR03437 family)